VENILSMLLPKSNFFRLGEIKIPLKLYIINYTLGFEYIFFEIPAKLFPQSYVIQLMLFVPVKIITFLSFGLTSNLETSPYFKL